MTKRILRNTKAVIAPSGKIERMLKEYGVEQPIKVVPTGLRLSRFSENIPANAIDELKIKLGIPQGNRIFITVGRAAKEKNIDELIRYFKLLDMKNAVLLIVGGGPYLDTLKAVAYSEHISDRVIFTGAVEPLNVAAYYKLGDVFLSASQSETQGLTYIEALASGLPAVCRRDDCLNGVIIDGKNGGQYTDFKQFSVLTEAILNNDGLYKAMSENAVRTAQKYSVEKFAKDVETIYMEILEKRDHYEIADTFYNSENCS